jgi:hypothetical protein
VACEIAYASLLENLDLLQEIREGYSVRTPERQLQIDLLRGYERLVPLEYYDLGAKEMERVVLFRDE